MTKRNNDWIVIEARALGMSWCAAAEAAGVCDRTVRRWKKNPEFMARLDQRQRKLQHETREHIAVELFAAATVGVEALVDVAVNSKNDPARVRAARGIFDQLPPVTDWTAPMPSTERERDDARESMFRKLEEMHQNMAAAAESSVEYRPEADKNGQTSDRSQAAAFRNPEDPFPAERTAAAQ